MAPFRVLMAGPDLYLDRTSVAHTDVLAELLTAAARPEGWARLRAQATPFQGGGSVRRGRQWVRLPAPRAVPVAATAATAVASPRLGSAPAAGVENPPAAAPAAATAPARSSRSPVADSWDPLPVPWDDADAAPRAAGGATATYDVLPVPWEATQDVDGACGTGSGMSASRASLGPCPAVSSPGPEPVAQMAAAGPIDVADPDAAWGPGFVPGPEHAAIAAATDGPGSFAIEAVAGAGKTTTLVGVAHRWLRANPAPITCVSFTRAAAESLAARMPHRVRTTTVDAWWCRLLGRRFDARGCVAAIAAAAAAHPMPGVTDRRALTAWAQTAVPLLWQIWPHPERLRPDAAWVTEALASRGGAGPSPATIADLMCQAAAIVIEGRGGDVDGVAAGLLILARPDLRGTCPRLLIDEAQDLNRLQIAVCAHLVGDGRVIAIGDPAQAIYGFRGSDHQAMEHLRAATGMGPPLSLPCSWRCPRRVVAFAAAIVPHLTAAPGAPEGKVEHREASAIDQTRSDLVSAVHEGRDVLLLSRVGAPLVEEALCLGDRLGPGRVGLRLGPGLGVVADDLRRAGLDRDPVACHTIEALVAWYRPALAQHAGPDRDRAHERLDLALTLARAAQARRCTLRQVLAGLAPRPGPGGRRGPRGGVLVATIHQAKGLEGDLCVVWGSDRMPHPRVLAGGSAAAIREEAHLAYVAATRTRDHLILQELPTRHP